MVYLSVIIIPAIVISVLLVVLFVVLKKRGKLGRVSSYGLALVLLVFWIAVYALSCINLDYRAAHFPYTQPGTTWKTESGNIVMFVSGDEVTEGIYSISGSADYNGSKYFTTVGTYSLDRMQPLDLVLLDRYGVVECSLSFKYRMPNDHTLIMTPKDPAAAHALLGGEKSLVLSRVGD